MDREKLLEHIGKSDLTGSEKIFLETLVKSAESVRYGHWIVKEIEHCMEYDAICSCCGFTFAGNYDGYVDTRDCLYCMNCGAKMDEYED